MLFTPQDLPIIYPAAKEAEPPLVGPRRVYIAVYNKQTGKISQVVECFEHDADKQHVHWDGHDYLEVHSAARAHTHAVDVKTGKLIDKDRSEEIAAQKVREARHAASDMIVGGFLCNALGKDHVYPSNPTDQQNMLTTAMTGGLIMCALAGKWKLRPHTQVQAQAVLAAFVAHRDSYRAAIADLE